VISRRILVHINLPEGPITSEWARDEADRLAGEWPDAVTDEQREGLWVKLGELMVAASLGKGRKPGQEGLPPGESEEFGRYLLRYWSPREQALAKLECIGRIFDLSEARSLARRGKAPPLAPDWRKTMWPEAAWGATWRARTAEEIAADVPFPGLGAGARDGARPPLRGEFCGL
jgi:hypothetical protein